MKRVIKSYFHSGQNGYTLIEMILGVALAGILVTGITVFSLQTMTVTDHSGNRMQALMQVENAGFWISRDVQMSRNITLGQNAGFPLELRWTDTDNNTYQVTYSVNNDSINRSLVKNSLDPVGSLIAKNVDTSSSSTNVTETNGLLKLRVTCTSGNVDVNHTYEIQPRLALLSANQ